MPKDKYELMEEHLRTFKAERYVEAFRYLDRKRKVTDKQREMLRVHCEAGTITATQLGEAVGYTYKGFNSQYGGLAHLVGERLGLTRVPKVPLRPHYVASAWLNVLATSKSPGPAWEFTMRPNVARALKRMGWCRRIPGLPPPNSKGADTDSESEKSGGGRGEQNPRVEREAVEAVTRDYHSRGWTVESKEKQAKKPGYDLLCSRGPVVHHVEVKGISGPVCSFEITANEKKRAEDDPAFWLIAVTQTLNAKRRRLTKFTGPELIRRFSFTPTSFSAKLR
jgi:hypothetical protein